MSTDPRRVPTEYERGYADGYRDTIGAIRAAAQPAETTDAPADCNCGWGGVHDPDNPRCDANGEATPESKFVDPAPYKGGGPGGLGRYVTEGGTVWRRQYRPRTRAEYDADQEEDKSHG